MVTDMSDSQEWMQQGFLSAEPLAGLHLQHVL